jgi:hypothetical protein
MQKTRKSISPSFLGYLIRKGEKGLRGLWTEKNNSSSFKAIAFSFLLNNARSEPQQTLFLFKYAGQS